MITIAVGGLEKHRIEQSALESGGEDVKVIVATDMEAARGIKAGKIDYYFGACNSGGGAAIAILIGILGYSKCCTVAKAGGTPNEKNVKKMIDEGKIAFGMSVENIETSVPILVKHLLNK